jgi:carbon starvation protein
LITLLPLAWLLAATMTAGVEKIWHNDSRIGFLAQARALDAKLPELQKVLAAANAGAEAAAVAAAEKALHTNRILRFNNLLDAAVAAVFLVLVAAIVVFSVREWVLLLARRKLAMLRETEPVWLPARAAAEGRPLRMAGLVALGFALARELSGQAHMERAQHATDCCSGGPTESANSSSNRNVRPPPQNPYVRMTEDRFNGIRRCC